MLFLRIIIVLLFMGVRMDVSAQVPDWVVVLQNELGPEVMSKSADELTGEDLFKIYHVTKDINGADDGVFPMIEFSKDKIKPIIYAKLSSDETPEEEVETAKEIATIFFEYTGDLSKLRDN